IHVLPSGEVEIRAPLRCATADIQAFVIRQSDWIEKKLAGMQQRAPELSFVSGEKLHFLGNELEISLTHHSKRVCVLGDNALFLYAKVSDTEKERRDLVRRWLTRQAEKILAERFRMVASRCHFVSELKPLKLRWMKRRWGSCSSRGEIMLNIDLIRYPLEMVDYVIAHELCHLVHFNHSPAFYRLLGEIFPDWAAQKRALQQWHQRYGHQLAFS
ncbi:MAG TPA: SprT family zinc-dependent metalloprotease, partial [Pseudomonadales bacterium]|nr:SprT family zinc-dependent metalloprotease [Pseudomonadales bacterium]